MTRKTATTQSSNPPATIEAYLAQQQDQDLLRFITCGSVDDGKSTLIGRLLWDAQQLTDDQLAALKSESKKHGTQGGEIDFALLVDGLGAVLAGLAFQACQLVIRQLLRFPQQAANQCALAIIDAAAGDKAQQILFLLLGQIRLDAGRLAGVDCGF